MPIFLAIVNVLFNTLLRVDSTYEGYAQIMT